MVKNIAILFLLFTLLSLQQVSVSAQSVSGTVVYRQKIDLEFPDIQNDTLRFNKTKSIFYWNTANFGDAGLRKMKKKYPNAKRAKKPIKLPQKIYSGLRINFFDTERDSLYSLIGMNKINKLLYLKEKAPTINWQFHDSTKRIGNYTVQKATARFRGRNYTAWFSPKIAVPFGPWKLHGLPGLILQAYDQSGNIYFSVVKVSFKNNGPIGPITLNGNEKVISLPKYKEIISNHEKYMKRELLKEVRPYVSREDFANMTVHLPNVKLMETFQDSTDQ